MKTAVEWLVDKLKNNHGIDLRLYSEFEKAKEMKKEQIMEAAKWLPKPFDEMQFLDELGKEYYNQTFKSE